MTIIQLTEAVKCIRTDISNLFTKINSLVNNPITNTGIIQVNLPTYAALTSYAFTRKPVRFEIAVDSNKNLTNTIYNWSGYNLQWSAEQNDTFQPTTVTN